MNEDILGRRKKKRRNLLADDKPASTLPEHLQGKRFLNMTQVRELTSLARSSVYRMAQTGDFPSPVRVGKGRVSWVEAEVVEWQEAVLAERV